MASEVGKKEGSFFLEACNWSSSRKIVSNDAELIPSKSSSCIDGQCVSSETSNIVMGCSSNESKPAICHKNRDSSNQTEKHDLLDSSVDDLSCIVRSDNGDMAVDNFGVNNEKKDASSNSSSVNDVLFNEKTIFDQVNEHCETCRHSEMLQSKKNISDSPSLGALPNQLDPSEISSLRNFSMKGEASICSEEKEGLSCDKTITNRISCHLQCNDSLERSDGSTICQQEITVSEIHSVSEEHKEKLYHVHGGPYREELPLLACVAAKNNASDSSYDEVRVCDICGDVGRENMLAVCSKCTDGAEHIYCMWVKMDKVPEGNWMCEECAVQEKAEKEMKILVGRAEKCQRESSLKTMTKKDKGLGNSVETSGLVIQKRRINKVGKFPDKSGSMGVQKRKLDSFAKSSSFPSSSQKKLIRQHISIENVDEGKYQGTCTSQVSLNSSLKGFMRSKSFHIGDKSVDGYCSLKFGCPKTDVETNGHKTKNGRKVCKSKPFNAGSSCSGTDDSEVKKTSTSSHVEGQSNVEDKKVEALGGRKFNPMLSSHKTRVHATAGEKISIMPCPLESPLVSNKPQIGEIQGHKGPNKLPKSTSDLSQSGLNLDSEHCKVLGDARRHFGNYKEEKSATKVNNLKFDSGFQMPISQVTFPSRKLVLPQPDFSWKGEFEVVKIGGVSSSLSRFQAHLSNSASPEVLDVVKKFPQKLMLNEVSRLCTWPAQFSEKISVEQDIALFFFTEDHESYEKNYMILSDRMVKEDLALKGCIDGVEMLIFLSDILPEGSQRWNGLSYLWCVLRNQTVNSHEDQPNSACNIPDHATEACLPAHPMNGDQYSSGQSSALGTSCDEEQNSNSSSLKKLLHASFMRSNNPSASSSKEKVSLLHGVENQDLSMISASIPTEQFFHGSVCDNNFLQVDGKDSSKNQIWELSLQCPVAKRDHDCCANENLFSRMNMSHSCVDAKHCNRTSIIMSPSFSMFRRDVKTADYEKADHEEWFAPAALDLELSLGHGKKPGRGLAMMLKDDMLKDNYNDAMTNNDEVSTGLALTLAPPLAR